MEKGRLPRGSKLWWSAHIRLIMRDGLALVWRPSAAFVGANANTSALIGRCVQNERRNVLLVCSPKEGPCPGMDQTLA